MDKKHFLGLLVFGMLCVDVCGVYKYGTAGYAPGYVPKLMTLSSWERQDEFEKILREGSASHSYYGEDLKYLIEKGVDIHVKDKNGMTTLHLAAKDNRGGKIVELLLDKGADKYVNTKDKEGKTPLHLAAALDSPDAVTSLVFSKANVNAKDNLGRTPLHYVTNPSVGEVLMWNKVNVNAVDNEGITPLHIAAKNGNKDLCEFLIEKGADYNAKDKKGKKPADYIDVDDFKTQYKGIIDKYYDFFGRRRKTVQK